MNILHLGKYYWPYRGGIEAVTRQLAEAAVRAGHRVCVLAHAGPGGPGRSQLDGVELVLTPVLFQALYTPLAPRLPVDLLKVLRELRPALVHIHLPNPAAFWVLLLPGAWRARWVLHWHSDVEFQSHERLGRWVYRLIYRPLEWCLLRRAAAVIVTSPNYRDSSRPLARFLEKCAVIPLYHDIVADRQTSPSGESDELSVLMVGRNTPYKGHRVLIEALAKLVSENLSIKVRMVGVESSDITTLPSADELQSAGRLECLGHVDDSELSALFAGCDLFCLPSLNRAEAFGLVLLEAMAHGKPLLASNLPDSGVGWLVDDGENGWVFPPGDSLALSERLVWCLRHRSELVTAGQCGREKLAAHFSSASVSEQLLSLYSKVEDGQDVTDH